MRYAASNLSDRIGADSCPCAFHWLQYLLGQPRLSKNFSRGASCGPLRARRRAELQASFSRPHRVRDCHHDHRCGALAAGFSEHQPVAVAHAMGLSTGRVLPSVAPALASVAAVSGREVPAISELRRRGPLVSVVPGLRSPLPDAVRKSAGVDRLVRAVAVEGDGDSSKGLRFEFLCFRADATDAGSAQRRRLCPARSP